jgi:integrase
MLTVPLFSYGVISVACYTIAEAVEANMRNRISKRTVDALRPGEKDQFLWDTEVIGFGCKCTPLGRKVYLLQYRPGGGRAATTTRLTIGVHGSGWTPETARVEAIRLRGLIATGADPAAQKRNARDEPAPNTFSSLASEFIARYGRVNLRPSSLAEAERVLRVEVIPVWGDRPIDTIRRRDVISLIDGMADRGAPVAANRALARLRKIFSWAVEREIIETSPAVGIKMLRETPRDRTLDSDELRAVWKSTSELKWPFAPIVQLLTLTAQRKSEVSSMRWSELSPDMTLWTIPAERTKNGRAHEVPLPAGATAILRDLPRHSGCDLVFTTNGRTAVSGHAAAKRRLDELSGVHGWVFHDLRRSAATYLASLGVAPHVVELLLNHQPTALRGVASVYNRYSYLDERRRALAAWADRVLRLDDGANVVRLRS